MGCLSLEGALVGVGLVTLILSSGVTYGWTALEVVLKKDGLYADMSTAERNTKLELIMNVAMVCVNAGGICFGHLLDMTGPVVTNAVAATGFCLSCFIFGYGWNLIFGYGLMAFCGAGVLSAGFRLGPTFPAKTALVMTAVTCMFDSSTIVFMIFDALNQQFGMTVKVFFTLLAALVACLNVVFISLWVSFQRRQKREDELMQMDEPGADEESLRTMEKGKEHVLTPAERASRLSDASDFDVNFKPARRMSGASLNSGVLAAAASGAAAGAAGRRMERNPSFASHGGRSAMTRGSGYSRLSQRSALARSTISCIEEALAVPPEERRFNEVVGVTDAANAPLVLNASLQRGLHSFHSTEHAPPSTGPGQSSSAMARLLYQDPHENAQFRGDSSINGLDALDVHNDASVSMPLRDSYREALEAAQTPPASKVPLFDMTFGQQVASKEWRFLIIMALITIYRTQWYMSATQPYLESIGDTKNTYSQITSLILPFEACFVPLTMYVLQRKGLYIGALVAVAMGSVHCILEVTKVLPLQIVVAVFMTSYRSMAFSVVNTFIVKVFGMRNVGKHSGTLRGLSGLVVLTQLPLMSFIQHQLKGNFFYEHIVACALMVALLCMILWLKRVSKVAVIFRGQ